mgnify:CR=1 FL=1
MSSDKKSSKGLGKELDKGLEKSPYGQHSIGDVLDAENGNYYLQVGEEIFSTDLGKMAFNKDRVEHFYQKTWNGLLYIIKTGSEEEKLDAYKCLLSLKIHPLRIH